MSIKFKNEVIEYIKTICVSLVFAIAIALVAQPVKVSGKSMYPTLENKDYLIVNKLSYMNKVPERGDIIIFKTDLIDSKTNKNKNLVKRVIALPGEHLVINNSMVYINGEHLDEEYLNDVYTDGDIDIIVPDNHIFAMGDNRENSDDSRKSYIGTISLEDIIGKAFIRLYPFNKAGQL